ncbi:MAG: MBL fold metallo-hydrolase [Anaerolineales bacterium]|nr:MBL fold metallo-hydrolase [Anaerolineales bacterium]
MLLILLLALATVSTAHAGLNRLTVSYIDVGQGDSIWLRASDGTDILVDGGPVSAGPTVVAYLQQNGVDNIEVMVLTHPDADHVGGLIDVLESTIPVDAVVYSGQGGTTVTYNRFVSAMQTVGLTPTPVSAGQEYTWGSVQASVLNPQSTPASDPNENSVVLLVTYEDSRWMLTGDIGAGTEQVIVSSGADLRADVLKVAHHGSAYSTSPLFLDTVQPGYAVISVGTNSYGHPAQVVLDRLAGIGAHIMRTDELGTIVLRSDELAAPIDLGYVVLLPVAFRPAASEAATVQIIFIFYDGLEPYVEGDEYAVIKNTGGVPVNLDGWRLNAGAPGQDFYFPAFIMQPGQECRVYTNEYHPEYCGFNFESPSALWSNSGDCGYLYDATGQEVSMRCY